MPVKQDLDAPLGKMLARTNARDHEEPRCAKYASAKDNVSRGDLAFCAARVAD
ncbi:hypothetical protein J2X09_005219 [Hydrogenophaga laconesensis]|uniref:Uncharacterized protein n=1 Tax=Hydrogenophaga laconesensis TaxID=1805971 RepID=A0ABU1VIY0_9BURK|nr:hypothetical protein [Hydrogenophaga laconesensis]